MRSVFAQWNGQSSLVSEGDDWLRKRRLVQPAFSPKRFSRYGEVMVRFTNRLADVWQTNVDASGHCEVEITKAMTELTLDIIAKTMFDQDVHGQTGDLATAVAISLKWH